MTDTLSDKTAKRLKEAGFDFHWDTKCAECGAPGDHFDCDAPKPSLSELIEACGVGNRFFLTGLDGEDVTIWHATKYFDDPHCNEHHKAATGKTPREAVSELYIALQEKRNPVWVCETHNDRVWSDDDPDCPGPGMLQRDLPKA